MCNKGDAAMQCCVRRNHGEPEQNSKVHKNKGNFSVLVVSAPQEFHKDKGCTSQIIEMN